MYDIVLAPLEWSGLRRWRTYTVAEVGGRVLEIGAGTGRNLPYYRRADLILLTDPDAAMLERARRRRSATGCPVHRVVARAEMLPFRDGSFDAVIATLVFCTVGQPASAIGEIKRVLAGTGELRLLEHVRTPRNWVARLQDLFTPAWRRVARGCHLNRQPLETARAHGFEAVSVERRLDGWLLAASLRPSPSRPGRR